MSTSLHEYLGVLTRYHRWAGLQLMDAASRLTPAEFRTGELSHGDVVSTLTHVVDVSVSWRNAAQGEPDAGIVQVEEFGELYGLWQTDSERLLDYVASLRANDLDREVIPAWKDRPFRVWWIVSHIVHHQVDHGNEIARQLTTLGRSPGEIGLMRFLDTQR